MFWKRRKSVYGEPSAEPLFAAVRNDDPEMRRAFAQAADTVDDLVRHLGGGNGRIAAVKMRFRDPDESARPGEDRFVYLWLTLARHDPGQDLFVVRFFEVPLELQKWHRPGEQLVIERGDIFDWFVNEDGLMHGGFTMRVARSRMPEADRAAFDKYTGVRQWVTAARS